MRPLLQHASRLLSANTVSITPPRANNLAFKELRKVSNTPSICWSCQFRASSAFVSRAPKEQLGFDRTPTQPPRRQFSSSKIAFEEKRPSESTEARPEPALPREESANPSTTSPDTPPKAQSSKIEDTIARVPAEDLPSHKEGQRWGLSKRFSEFMDELLPKLAVVTHKVNIYTGTDYSGIEALRREIKEQEQLVKARRRAIEEAKQALDAAHAKQASSQKEVVALLERKHSWSATDLERYMSLIRSEHVNDQAVREAKEAGVAAENALEEARSQLERRERAQYHEEQIWSDTIRRNSTWVTFGLMGFNIFLLLASLLAIEPWRRRRMVREIKTALEAQKPTIEAASALQASAAIETAIDEVVEPIGQPLEEIPVGATAIASSERQQYSLAPKVATTEHSETAGAYNTANPATKPPATATLESTESVAAIDIEDEVKQDYTWLEKLAFRFSALRSEEQIYMRKKDFTAAVIISAATGWLVASIVDLIMTRWH